MRKIFRLFAEAFAIVLYEISHGSKRKIKHIDYYTVSNTFTCTDWADQKINVFSGEFTEVKKEKLRPYCSFNQLPDMQTTIQVWNGKMGFNKNLVYDGPAENYFNYSIYPPKHEQSK